MMLELSDASRTTAAVLLLSVVAIEYGGTFMLRVVRGRVPVTPFQESFARAGHAHAGVLVILGLVCQPLVDAARMSGAAESIARSGIPLAAILMSSGFFLSSIGRDRREPNRLIVLLWAGVASLGVGAVSLGIGLLTA
jgi:hypothetical protein